VIMAGALTTCSARGRREARLLKALDAHAEQPQRIMTRICSRHHRGRLLAAQAGPNSDSGAYTGTSHPRRRGVGLIGESHRGNVGFAGDHLGDDRLYAGWSAARNLRRDRPRCAAFESYRALAGAARRDCGIVTVIDGHRPRSAGSEQRARPPGRGARGRAFRPDPARFPTSTATTASDANAIIDAAEGLSVGAPVRHRKMAV